MNLDDPAIRADLMGKLSASALDDEATRNDIMARLQEASSPMGVVTDVVHSGAEGFNKGLAGAVDTYVNKPVESLINLGGSAVNTVSDLLGYGKPVPSVTVPKMADTFATLGLSDHTPATKAGQYAASVGEGVGQSAPFIAAAPVAGAIGGANAANAVTRATGNIAQNLAVGAGSGVGQQVARDTGQNEIVGAIAGGLTGQGLATAGAKAVGAARNVGQGSMYQDFVDAGVTPRLPGDATESPMWGRIQSSLGAVGYRDIYDAARQQVDDLARAAEGIAGNVGTGRTLDDAGTALISGANTWRSNWQNASTRLYGAFDGMVPSDTRVALDNTLDVLTGGSRQFPDTPNMSRRFESPLFRGLLDDLNIDAANGTISFRSLQSARSKVGERLAAPSLVTDADRADLNRLYGALSADMEQAAVNAGPDAANAFQTATGHYRDGLNRINGDLAPLLRENATAVDAYQYAMGQAQRGVDRLEQLRAAMPDPEWNRFVSSEIRRLGSATPGAQNATADAFSPATFLTNYAKLQRSGAADVLFAGDLKTSLDRMARITESLKNSQKLWNHSNSAGTSFWLGILRAGAMGGGGGAAFGVAPTAALSAALTFTGGKIGAALFTTPAFVKWLATAAEDTSMTGRGILSGVARFAMQAAANDPDIRDDVDAKLQQAWNVMSSPTTDYVDRLNAYAEARRSKMRPDALSNPTAIVQSFATVDPAFASELQAAAERSPTAYKGMLWDALKNPQRRELAERVLGINNTDIPR